MDISSVNSDLIRGNVTTIILGSLWSQDRYGYDILKEIETRSEGQYKLKQPTLYNQLKRLEKQGLISSYDGDPEDTGGGRRRYYSLTAEGRKFLVKERTEYEYSRTILDRLVSDRAFDFEADPAPFNTDDLRPYIKKDQDKSRVVYKEKEVEKVVYVDRKIYFDADGNEVSEEEAKASARSASAVSEEELKALEDARRAEIEALEEAKRAEIEALEAAHRAEVEELRRREAEETGRLAELLREAEGKSAAERAETVARVEAARQAEIARLEAQLDAAKMSMDERLGAIESAHREQIARLSAEREEALERTERELADKIREAEEQKQAEIESIRSEHEKELEEIEKRHEEELERIAEESKKNSEEIEARGAALEEEYAGKLRRLEEEREEAERKFEEERAALEEQKRQDAEDREKLEKADAERREELERIEREREEALSRLEEEREKFREEVKAEQERRKAEELAEEERKAEEERIARERREALLSQKTMTIDDIFRELDASSEYAGDGEEAEDIPADTLVVEDAEWVIPEENREPAAAADSPAPEEEREEAEDEPEEEEESEEPEADIAADEAEAAPQSGTDAALRQIADNLSYLTRRLFEDRGTSAPYAADLLRRAEEDSERAATTDEEEDEEPETAPRRSPEITLSELFRQLDERGAEIDAAHTEEEHEEESAPAAPAEEARPERGEFAMSAVRGKRTKPFEYEESEVNYREFFAGIAADSDPASSAAPAAASAADAAPAPRAEGDLKTRLYAEGFKLRPYDRGSTTEYYSFNFIRSNRILRDCWLIVMAIFLVEAAVMWACTAREISYIYFLPIMAGGAALMLIPTFVWMVNPTRRKRADFNVKLSVLNRGMMLIELAVVRVLIAFFAVGVSVNDTVLILETMVLPVILLTNLPLSSLVYYGLYRSKRYHTA